MATINEKVRHGVFEYAEYFPESKTALALRKADKTPTVKELGATWLQTKGHELKASTLSQYSSAVKCWCALLGEDTLVTNITAKVVKAKIGSHPWPSAKTFNNYLPALRGMFELEFDGGKTPVDGIKGMRWQKKPPDPLSIEERDKILERLRKRVRPAENDDFFLVFGPEDDCRTAAEEIRLRFCDATVGVPKETRQSLVGGFTTFERILPGPDRMYPDTDSPPTRVTKERVEEARLRLRPAPWDRIE